MSQDTWKIVESVTRHLKKRYGRRLLGMGVFGSVALGEEREYSDIDLLAVVLSGAEKETYFVYDRRLVSIHLLTRQEAEAEVSEPDPALPEILSGWRNLKILFDFKGLLRRLKRRSGTSPTSLFRESARLALLGAYEDLGKVLNAYRSREEDEAREMVIWFTLAAARALACLRRHVFSTDRRIFVELRGFRPLGELIWRLRFGEMSLRGRATLAVGIWNALLKEARRAGVINLEALRLIEAGKFQ